MSKRPDQTGQPHTTRQQSSEVLKNYTEVAALAVAGLWAIFTFCQKDFPNLRPRLRVRTDIKWSRVDKRCVAKVIIDITNPSNRTVDVQMVRYRAWTYSNTAYAAASTAYFDPETTEKQA